MADQTPDDTMALAGALLDAPRHVRFLKSLDEAKAKSKMLLDVEGTPYQQFGTDVLAFTCPVCGNVAGLSGEGRHQCRGCHNWLRIHRKE